MTIAQLDLAAERNAIVAWLRTEAAVTLWRDMEHFPVEMHAEVETVAEILEAYATAIEGGEHWQPNHHSPGP